MRYAFLVLLAAALAGCSRPSAVDPALEAFVPGDAVLLAGVRMEPLRNTPLFERLMASAGPLAAQTGFDPRKDARELLFASDGSHALLAARGTFRADAVPAGVPRSAYRGTPVYGAGAACFAIVDGATAVAGTPEAVRAALDRRATRAPRAALLSRTRSLPKDCQVWAVSSGSPELPGEGNFARILRAVSDVTFTADLRSGVRAEARGVCRDEKNARALADALRGFVALGRLAAPKQNPSLARLYDAVRIEQTRDEVRVTTDVPAEAAAPLLDLLLPGSRPLPAR